MAAVTDNHTFSRNKIKTNAAEWFDLPLKELHRNYISATIHNPAAEQPVTNPRLTATPLL